eukprot:gene15539-17124_t
MVIVQCSVPSCTFTTEDVTEALAIALLNNHGLAHQNMSDAFRSGSDIDGPSAPPQLFQCAGPALGDSLLKANPQVTSQSLEHLLSAMRSLAVIPVATCILRTDLLQMHQERDESFRAYSARVRGKAETCSYGAKCECGKVVDYTDHIIRDVLLNGIYDTDIRREVLGSLDILNKPINDVIALVEQKEMVRNALPTSNLSAMSAFQRQKKTPTSPMPTPSQADQNKESTCPQCNSSFKLFTQGARGWNTKPHQVCIDCCRIRRKKKRQQPGNVQVIESDPISQVSAIHHQERITPKQYQEPIRTSQTEASSCYMNSSAPKMEHHIFTKSGWRRARLRDHPRLPITISLDQPTTIADKDHRIQVTTTAIADTGAQSDLWSLDEYLSFGFLRDDLKPVKLSLAAANRSPISIEGAFFAKLSVTLPNGQMTSSRSMVYVSNSVRTMYLSYETLLNLGLLSQNFPSSENTIDSRNNDSSNELETAFQASKKRERSLRSSIHSSPHPLPGKEEGVELFDLSRRTCLCPDWSSHAEQQYAAIEGEALAVAWGLEQTRYFTQGCDNLVVTDHKPLVKIFGDRALDEISNTRLFRLKQRTLPWRFDIIHRPGRYNYAGDATSRHPSPSGSWKGIPLGTLSDPDLAESALVATIRNDTEDLTVIPWSLIVRETAQDDCLRHILHLLENRGSIDSHDTAREGLSPVCGSLYSQDGVLMYNDRVVVPQTLRHKVLQDLHSAYQGVSTMELRPRTIVYWPGMTKDIQEARNTCADCNRNSPSQATTPPMPSSASSTPFEEIFADFFDYCGHHYFVVGDRLSGWVEVLSSSSGSILAGSAGLICHLRKFFATFGVPQELPSGGGPEFISPSTENFLRTWNVRHRNQCGPHPAKWDRSGLVVESLGNDPYRVKVDRSGRLRLWNRRFLRAYTPFATELPQAAYIPFATEPPSVTYEPVTATPSAPRSQEMAGPQEIPNPSEVRTDSIPLLQPALQPVTEDRHQGSPTAVTPLPDRVGDVWSPPPTIPHTRPTRQRRPPKRYEPETGKWIA